MCIYIYTHTRIHIYIYICAYVYIYIYIHTHVCICIYTYMYTHVYIYIYIYIHIHEIVICRRRGGARWRPREGAREILCEESARLWLSIYPVLCALSSFLSLASCLAFLPSPFSLASPSYNIRCLLVADKRGQHEWGRCESNDFWQIGQKGTPWHFWEDKSGLTGVPKRSLCQKTWSLRWPH